MRATAWLAIVVTGPLAVLGACANRPEPFMGSAERGQMITHFDLALEARDLTIMGDVPLFRATARDLAELQPARDLPDELMLQLGPMRWEARAAAEASTVDEAARGTAEIARTCGDCHEANDAGLGERFTVGGPPPAGSDRRHMAGLAWATRLLWDGLVGPSDRTWYVGAEGLIELGALPEGIEDRRAREAVADASEHLRALGRAAASAESAEERVPVLADILSACGDCHEGSLRRP